jgi:hypothetical protein
MSFVKVKQINLNEVARKISKKEGLKKQIDIANIKEVMRHYTDILSKEYSLVQIMFLIKRFRQRK